MLEGTLFSLRIQTLAALLLALLSLLAGPVAAYSSLFGSLAATAGVTLPSLLLVLLVARLFSRYQNHPLNTMIFYGLRPAVVGLIASAAVFIGKTVMVTTTAGQTFDADEDSQNRMGRAIAAMSDMDVLPWVLADNTVATVTKAEGDKTDHKRKPARWSPLQKDRSRATACSPTRWRACCRDWRRNCRDSSRWRPTVCAGPSSITWNAWCNGNRP